MQLKSIVTQHKYTLMSNGDDRNAFFLLFFSLYFYQKYCSINPRFAYKHTKCILVSIYIYIYQLIFIHVFFFSLLDSMHVYNRERERKGKERLRSRISYVKF